MLLFFQILLKYATNLEHTVYFLYNVKLFSPSPGDSIIPTVCLPEQLYMYFFYITFYTLTIKITVF